jgi:DNA-binding ferritin-like protein
MPKQAKTTGEHIVELYGHITGLKKEICHIKDNHLRHLKEDIQNVRRELSEGQDKMSNKMDTLTKMIISGMGSIIILIITMVLKYYKIL